MTRAQMAERWWGSITYRLRYATAERRSDITIITPRLSSDSIETLLTTPTVAGIQQGEGGGQQIFKLGKLNSREKIDPAAASEIVSRTNFANIIRTVYTYAC